MSTELSIYWYSLEHQPLEITSRGCCDRQNGLLILYKYSYYRPQSQGDNMFGSVCPSVHPSVRPSVCLSVHHILSNFTLCHVPLLVHDIALTNPDGWTDGWMLPNVLSPPTARSIITLSQQCLF